MSEVRSASHVKWPKLQATLERAAALVGTGPDSWIKAEIDAHDAACLLAELRKPRLSWSWLKAWARGVV
jgi:hypothetical protein